MSAVPLETPVTNPVEETVAFDGADDTHGFEVAAIPDPVNCVAEFTHTLSVPLIVGHGTVTSGVMTVLESAKHDEFV